MKNVTYICDVCSKQRVGSDPWFQMIIHGFAFGVYAFDYPLRDEADGIAVLHICGAGCLQKKISKILPELKSDPTSTDAVKTAGRNAIQ